VYVLIFSANDVWNISHYKKNSIGLHAKYPLFLSDFNES